MSDEEKKKKSRLVLDEEDVEYIEKRQPTEEDKKEADRVFDQILKDKNGKK
jgi:hypothetical protein